MWAGLAALSTYTHKNLNNCFGADTVRDSDHQSRHSLGGGFCPAGHSAGLWPSRALRVHLPLDIRYIRTAPSVPSVPSIHMQNNLSSNILFNTRCTNSQAHRLPIAATVRSGVARSLNECARRTNRLRLPLTATARSGFARSVY